MIHLNPLIQVITDIKPSSLLLVSRTLGSEATVSAQEALCEALKSVNSSAQCETCGPDKVLIETPVAHVDLAILLDGFCSTTKTEDMQCIAKLRDQIAKHLVVGVNYEYQALWPMSEFIALGMKKLAVVDEQRPLTFYSYDILTYKHVPDWLNPKYWANPERWGKHRW